MIPTNISRMVSTQRPKGTAIGNIVVAALAIVILAALLAGAFLGDLWTFGDEGVSVKGIEERIRSWGPWGVGASIGPMALFTRSIGAWRPESFRAQRGRSKL